MSRFLKIISAMILLGFLITCGGSDSGTVEQAQIPESNKVVTFSGITWSDVKFKHQEHSDRYGGECIRCHDHESVAGQTHWYCRSCHTAGQDREALCTEVSEHGCIMTQCNNCHEVKGLNPGLGCMSCHPGGQLSGTDGQPPSVPTGLTATAVSSSQVDISWTDSKDNMAVAGYKIYRDGTFLKSVTTASTSDTGLTEITRYCYRVSAYDSTGNESGLSTESCTTTLDSSVPTPPQALSVGAFSPTETTLSWAASTDNVRVAGYKIYRGGLYVKSVTGTSTTDTVTAGTMNCYQVSAYDDMNLESDKSLKKCTSGLSQVSVSSSNPSNNPPYNPSLIVVNSIDARERVHYWSLNLATGGNLIIEVKAYEGCGAQRDEDYFGDGSANNRLTANIFLFKLDGTPDGSSLVASQTGMYPGGSHRPHKEPYLEIAVGAGTYVLAIGSGRMDEAAARSGYNGNGDLYLNNYFNYYKVNIYLN